jgi:hypothetical protein
VTESTSGFCPSSRFLCSLSIRARNAAQRMAWRVGIASLCLVIEAGSALALEKCEYPEYYTQQLVPPNLRLGEFGIQLAGPSYEDPGSVRDHLVFSLILGGLLSNREFKQSNELCRAKVPSRFPNLHVVLTATYSLNATEVDRASCFRILDDNLRNYQPTDSALLEAASAAMVERRTIFDPASASVLLPHALMKIYQNGTLMHTLFSIDDENIWGFDAKRFREWLDIQRASGLSSPTPIRTDCAAETGHHGVRHFARGAARIPHSHVIAPGWVTLSIKRAKNWVTPWPLRYLVIVGSSGPANGTIKYAVGKNICNADRRVTFDGENGEKVDLTVGVKCISRNFYDSEFWIALYCDAQECQSDNVGRAVATQIANDWHVVAAARENSRDRQPMGPFLVEVKVAGE